MDTSGELALITLVVSALLLLLLKPKFTHHTDGTQKTFGIGLDTNAKQKTLFTMPIILGMLSITVLVVSHKLIHD